MVMVMMMMTMIITNIKITMTMMILWLTMRIMRMKMVIGLDICQKKLRDRSILANRIAPKNAYECVKFHRKCLNSHHQ